MEGTVEAEMVVKRVVALDRWRWWERVVKDGAGRALIGDTAGRYLGGQCRRLSEVCSVSK